ncbi:MAG: single-stranded-DNA-specific exonuclease RecJ, partial [Betaproteobacteria bacterium]|nr:single-stranded-DNA-specific exonuclease RecJ [Betaproteobacteria bacterium]
TDGSLDAAHVTLQVSRMLEREIWGQGFPQPLFCDTFDVQHQCVVADRHLKLGLARDGRRYEAMWFNAVEKDRPVAARIRAVYRLAVNEFNGLSSVQLNLEHCE